ncbi:MAG: membrane protein insertion efficiency factor YidD [Sciscionella sp.]
MKSSRAGGARNPVVVLLVGVLSVYRRFLSPLFPPACRFYPSCSAYAVQALREHGALRGGWLTLRRLLRCGPWHPGGVDPVPPRSDAVTDGPATDTDLKFASGVEE